MIFCMLIQIQKSKVIKNLLGGHDQEWVWRVWSWDSEIDCISKLNIWNKLIFLHTGTKKAKLKVDSMIFGWPLSKMLVTI